MNRILVAALVAPICFLGFEGTPALRLRTRPREEREEARESTARGARRSWGIPSAYAGDITPTRESKEVQVRIHWMKNWQESADTCYSMGVEKWKRRPEAKDRAACNTVTIYEDGHIVCDVYVPRGDNVGDEAEQKLGHEIRHCLLGDYHD